MKNLVMFFSLIIVFNSYAWDAVGHRIVADIAYHNLNGKARSGCDKLLGKKGMIYQATWADEVRSDSSYNYSSAWHYQNLAENLSNSALQNLLGNPLLEGEHVFFAIEKMTERLKRDKNDAEALKFLVHFVGDVHQPMHLGHAADLGGNTLKVNWFRNATNLHSVWDGRIIEAKRMSYTEYSDYLQNKFKNREKEIKGCSFAQSMELVYRLSQKIYDYPFDDSNNYRYVYDFSDDTDEMLYRAGIMLANILNGIY